MKSLMQSLGKMFQENKEISKTFGRYFGGPGVKHIAGLFHWTFPEY